MRTTLKIVLPLIVSVAAVSLLFTAYQVRRERHALRDDLSRRAEILGESLQETIEPIFDRGADKNLQRIVTRFRQREHLKGFAVYDSAGAAVEITPGLSPLFRSRPAAATRAVQNDAGYGEFLVLNDSLMYVYALPLRLSGQAVGSLALFHDANYIATQVSRTLRDSLVNAAVQTLLITGLALVLVRWTFTGPLTRTAKWLRTLRTGQPHVPPVLGEGEIFDQLNKEVSHLARDLNVARATAEEEARLRDSVSRTCTFSAREISPST